MEKINYRFLNYKYYNKFISDLNDKKIREDSIVFIQDNLRIWARGKEYVCNGPYTSNISDIDGLVVKDGTGNVLLKISPNENGIILLSSNGKTEQYQYISKDTFDGFVITNRINLLALRKDIDNLIKDAFSGDYNDLINKPDPLFVDNILSSTSENPVLNKIIYEALRNKANNSDLNLYVLFNVYEEGIGNKQNKLVEGYGINIDQTTSTISTTLDTSVYTFVDNVSDVQNPNPNKIYIEESSNLQYRYKNGQWVSLGSIAPNVDLKPYLKSADAELLYLPKRDDYAIKSDLTPYATNKKLEDSIVDLTDWILEYYPKYEYLLLYYLQKGDYSTKRWVTENFVLKKDVYTPDLVDDSISGTHENDGSIIIPPSSSQIEVDTELKDTSDNPVANRIINTALKKKADKKWVEDNYATKEALESKIDSNVLNGYVLTLTYLSGLEGKLNRLTAGSGISIVDDVISSTLDTDVFIIVSDLQNVVNPSENKIYLLETTQDNETVYIEYRYKNGQWIEIGLKDPNINLESYLSKTEAADIYLTKSSAISTYQPIGNYITRTEALTLHDNITNQIRELENSLEDYATDTQIESLRLYVANIYQRKGNYALAQDVSTALTVLQLIIDQKYVLKKDVYNPNQSSGWSTEDPTTISIGGSTGGNSSGGVGTQSNMVTLTTLQYLLLVDNNLVDENTYYFTYEGEEETTTNWKFGDKFPVILSADNWVFGDQFPVILTGQWTFGGTFPVILN